MNSISWKKAGSAALLCASLAVSLAGFAQAQDAPNDGGARAVDAQGRPLYGPNAVGIIPPAQKPGEPDFIYQGVTSWSRFPQDVWADPYNKPSEMLQLSGVKVGDKIVDITPHDLYWSRLFAKTVGLKGYVYPFVPQIGCRPAHPGCTPSDPTSTSVGYGDLPVQGLLGDPRSNGIDKALETQNLWDYGRNLAVIWNVNGQFSVPEQADVAMSFGGWHDWYTWDYSTPMDKFLPLLFAGVQRGGVLIVADYASAPGRGFQDADTLHRVDKEAVKAQLVKAGFEFVTESNMYANAKDNHTSRVAEGASAKDVDMFVLKFKKPMSAPKDQRMQISETGDWQNGVFAMIWFNKDGTYQEWRGPRNWSGRWFFDATGQFCLWNEYPDWVRGSLGCHAWESHKYGDKWYTDAGFGRKNLNSLSDVHHYPLQPPYDLPPAEPKDRIRY